MLRSLLLCCAFAVLASLHVGIPLSMLVGRAAILRSGTEIRLDLATRDPRSLFRGEYSVLAYTIGNLRDVPAPDEERARCQPASRDCLAEAGTPLFVVIEPGDNGVYRPVTASLTQPPSGTLFIRGKIRSGSYQTRVDAAKCPSGRCFSGAVTYGIETWFGPQGVPAQVDRATRSQLQAVVRVDRTGTAVLADILLDGKAVGR
jgi:uncharacterized membrane-anchored protein